jgi:hypothetical protein
MDDIFHECFNDFHNVLLPWKQQIHSSEICTIFTNKLIIVNLMKNIFKMVIGMKIAINYKFKKKTLE